MNRRDRERRRRATEFSSRRQGYQGAPVAIKCAVQVSIENLVPLSIYSRPFAHSGAILALLFQRKVNTARVVSARDNRKEEAGPVAYFCIVFGCSAFATETVTTAPGTCACWQHEGHVKFLVSQRNESVSQKRCGWQETAAPEKLAVLPSGPQLWAEKFQKIPFLQLTGHIFAVFSVWEGFPFISYSALHARQESSVVGTGVFNCRSAWQTTKTTKFFQQTP